MPSFISRTKYGQEHYFSNVPLVAWNDAAALGTECESVWLHLMWQVACERRRLTYTSSKLSRRYAIRDIADYLGMHIANVRRALHKLAEARLIDDVVYEPRHGETGRYAVAVIRLHLSDGWTRYYGRSTDVCPTPSPNAANTIQMAHYIGKVGVHAYLRIQALGKRAALAWRLLQFSYDCEVLRLNESAVREMSKVAAKECEVSRKVFAEGVCVLRKKKLLPTKPSRRVKDEVPAAEDRDADTQIEKPVKVPKPVKKSPPVPTKLAPKRPYNPVDDEDI